MATGKKISKGRKTASTRQDSTTAKVKGSRKAVGVISHPEQGIPAKENLIQGQIQPQTSILSGPRKARAEGPPPPRLSHHKRRSVWFQARAAWPIREAPVHFLVRERARVAKALAPS